VAAGENAADFNPAYLIWLPPIVLATFVGATILQAVLVHATVIDQEGQRPKIGESLSIGLRAFWPLVGVGILSAIAYALGFMLLIVPGVMLLCAWCVAAPALITEGTGVTGAFKRSAVLTRGNRWRIFGLGLMVVLIVIGISLVIGLVSGLGVLALGAFGLIGLAQGLGLVLNVLVQALSTMVGAAGVAVLFVELRRVREGGGDHLAKIFA
jgi:hypothetical protein